jgi:hypothetical protein
MTDMVRGAALSVSEFAELSILAKATIAVVVMLLAGRAAAVDGKPQRLVYADQSRSRRRSTARRCESPARHSRHCRRADPRHLDRAITRDPRSTVFGAGNKPPAIRSGIRKGECIRRSGRKHVDVARRPIHGEERTTPRAHSTGVSASEVSARILWSGAGRRRRKVPRRNSGSACAISIDAGGSPGNRPDGPHRVLRRGSRDDRRTRAAATAARRARPVRPLVRAVDLHRVTGTAWPQAGSSQGVNRRVRYRSSRPSGPDCSSRCGCRPRV